MMDVRRQHVIIACVLVALFVLFTVRPADVCSAAEPRAAPQSSAEPAEVVIYGITPTYMRRTQKADLTRLSQTLMLVRDFHWIVVEDSPERTALVADLLRESGLTYTHLNVKTIKDKKSTASGVEQRNEALKWLRQNLLTERQRRGVVYFMDDDNTYSLKVFDEMRKIKNGVGVWPVGLVGGMRVEMPLVSNDRVIGYNAVWKPMRPFPIDMAGFAILARLILRHPEAKFSRQVQSGYQESEILKYVTRKEDLEPLADNCTKVYVWHTRTLKPSIIAENKRSMIPPHEGLMEV